MVIGVGLINIRVRGGGEVVIPKPLYYLILSRYKDELEISMW